jgi:tetratricopeptide (TPR) repeat protein
MIKVQLRRLFSSPKILFWVIITGFIIIITLLLGYFGVPYKYIIYASIAIIVYALIENYWPTNYAEKVKRLCDEVNQKKYESALEKINKFLEKNKSGSLSSNDYLLLYCAKARCLLELGIKCWDINKLKDAIMEYKKLLELFKKQGIRKSYYTELANMCTVYRRIALITNEENYLREAFKQYEVLLNEINKEEDVNLYSYLKSQIGFSYLQKFYFDNNIDNVNRAINSFEGVIECYKRKGDINYLKLASGIAGRILFEITKEREYKIKAKKNIEEALVYYENSIKDVPLKYFPGDYAWVCFNLGICYSELCRLHEGTEYIEKSCSMLSDAKNVYMSLNHHGMINVINSYQNNDKILL